MINSKTPIVISLQSLDGLETLYRTLHTLQPHVSIIVSIADDIVNYAEYIKNIDKRIVAVTEQSLTPEEVHALCASCQRPVVPVEDDPYCRTVNTMAADLLKRLGVPVHLSGYQYLIYVVTSFTLNPQIGLKQDVFPVMEREYNVSAKNIDRAMRYAIEVAWGHGDLTAQHELFGYTIDEDKGKPVVRELASMLAEHIRQGV